MAFPTPEELPYSLTLNGNPYRVEGERRYSYPRMILLPPDKSGGYSQETPNGVSCTMHKTFSRKVYKQYLIFSVNLS
jgi:hypothetical protein